MLLFLKGIAAGGFAGFFSGLLGIGSGSIIVPFLYLLFSLPIKVAIGTSLFIIFFSSMSGFLIHLKEKNFDLKLAILLTIGGVIGAQTGAKLTKLLPDTIVKIVFIIVIVFLGFRLLISKEREYQSDKNGYTLTVWKTFLIGFLGGVVSGLCGVGGAIFLVPLVYLILKVPIKICVGTSLLVIFFNSLSGTISYAVGGYINYKIGIIFAIGAIIFAPIGAKVSVKTPRLLLRRIFGVFLILTPLLLFFRK